MEKNIDVAKDIKISESTLAIIQCRAKICDINNELAEALESEYPEMEIAKMMEGY